MPNWTSNVITVKHSDPTRLDLIQSSTERKVGVLQTLIPCPEELLNEELTTWGHGAEEEARKRLRAEMVAKHGHESWYDWNIANWGTKWDLCETSFNRVDDNTLEIHAQTAWSPPSAAFDAMVTMGYEVRALYCGEAYEYAGIWDNGVETNYNTTSGSQAAATSLPQELDEAFNIVEGLEEYERENEEELTTWIKDGVEQLKEED